MVEMVDLYLGRDEGRQDCGGKRGVYRALIACWTPVGNCHPAQPSRPPIQHKPISVNSITYDSGREWYQPCPAVV